MFYVYEWFNKRTGEIFYVGKGTKNRYKVRKHNKSFNNYILLNDCDSRIIKYFKNESDAFNYEATRISDLKTLGQCVCNISPGGVGGTTNWWTEERKKYYSENNIMKSEKQRKRMSDNNPMRDNIINEKVAQKVRRPVVIGGIRYASMDMAAKKIGVTHLTITNWCSKGKNPYNQLCFYEDGKPKKTPKKTIYKHKLSPQAKKIYIDGIIYSSMADAARSLNSTPSNLRAAIKKNGMFKGHVCKYANQQPSQGKSNNSTLEGSTTNE